MNTRTTINLTDDFVNETPVAYMVFTCKPVDNDYMIFVDEREAKIYAMEQEEWANMSDGSVPIYALWATNLYVSPERQKDVQHVINKS